MSYEDLNGEQRAQFNWLKSTSPDTWPGKLREFAVGMFGGIPKNDHDRAVAIVEWLNAGSP